MKTIGLIGGLSWESTRIYYELINTRVRDRMGGLHSAPMVVWSVDFAPIAQMQAAGQWDEAGAVLAQAAVGLERAGAELVAIASNTMHRCADQVAAPLSVPFLHITDPLADALQAAGCKAPVLLATRFTMEGDFIRGRLRERGVEASIPEEADRAGIHRIIYDELCQGVVLESARAAALAIVAKAREAGADGLILGCTELCMILDDASAGLPLFDTTAIHCAALADAAMG